MITGASQYQALQDVRNALKKLAPCCGDCQQAKLYLCTEKCCRGSQPFCLQCESHLHFLHRTNHLELLLTTTDKKSYNEWLPSLLTTVLNRTTLFRREVEEVVRANQEVVVACNCIIEQVEKLRTTVASNWHSNLQEVVRNQASSEDAELAQRRFLQAVKSIDLYQKNSSHVLSQLNRLLAQYKKSHNEALFRPFSGPLSFVLVEPGNLLEDYFRNTCLQRYVDSSQLDVFANPEVRPFRSIQIGENYSYSSEQLYRRVAVQNLSVHNRIYELDDRTVEVHTTCNLVALPSQLRSLTYDTRANWQFLQRIDLTDFPASLVVLRLGLFDRLAYDSGKCYNIDHLVNLKYLVVSDPALRPCDQRQLVRFAIDRNLEMLCLLNGASISHKFRLNKTVYRLEARYQHYYPQLKQHYVVRCRKIMQIQLLNRQRLLRNSFFAELVLGEAEDELDRRLDGIE